MKKEEEQFEEDEDEDADEKVGGVAQPMLDYRQYYPTVLPMRPPGHEVLGYGDSLDDSKPPDLETLPVRRAASFPNWVCHCLSYFCLSNILM